MNWHSIRRNKIIEKRKMILKNYLSRGQPSGLWIVAEGEEEFVVLSNKVPDGSYVGAMIDITLSSVMYCTINFKMVHTPGLRSRCSTYLKTETE